LQVYYQHKRNLKV